MNVQQVPYQGGSTYRAYTVTHTSDTALDDEASGGSQMGSTLSSIAIPSSGFIRLTILEGEFDETGASANGRMGMGIDVGGTLVWPQADAANGADTDLDLGRVDAGTSDVSWRHGTYGSSQDSKARVFDIEASGFPTGSQDVKVFMRDKTGGSTGEVTITGSTTTARFLVEIVKYTA